IWPKLLPIMKTAQEELKKSKPQQNVFENCMRAVLEGRSTKHRFLSRIKSKCLSVIKEFGDSHPPASDNVIREDRPCVVFVFDEARGLQSTLRGTREGETIKCFDQLRRELKLIAKGVFAIFLDTNSRIEHVAPTAEQDSSKRATIEQHFRPFIAINNMDI